MIARDIDYVIVNYWDSYYNYGALLTAYAMQELINEFGYNVKTLNTGQRCNRKWFKKSFMEGFTSMDITTSKVLATLCMVVILALYIFLIYRVVTRKTFYSKNFAVSLAATAVITAGIILAMQSNLVISVGMVGA